jgi:pimeloyl-ACP methyl ester carboxylesterase
MSRKRLALVALLAAAPFLLFAAVRGSAVLVGSILEKRYPPPGRLLSVGDHRLHLYCMGNGGPTVVIEPGIGTDWVGWRLVVPRLLESNRVCVYDRAGYGWSAPGPWPRTAQRIAGELHALLSRAGVSEPYILVAHSFGGYVARIYASQYRQSLKGVVLVDPSHEEESTAGSNPEPVPPLSRRVLELIPPLGIQRLKRLYAGDRALNPELRNLPRGFQTRYLLGSSLLQLRSERNEFDSLPETKAQMRLTPFPADLPLTVITAGHNPEQLELHAKLARSSIYGRQIVAEHSGHMIPLDQPDLIVEAVREMVKPSR